MWQEGGHKVRWFLTQLTHNRGVAWPSRKQAIEFRFQSEIAVKAADTVEVIPLREVVALLTDWHEMLPKMKDTLTPGELAIHRSCMQDLLDRLNHIRE